MMLIRKRQSWDLSRADVTPEPVYRARRQFVQGASLLAVAGAFPAVWPDAARAAEALSFKKMPVFSSPEPLTPYEDVVRYNNFYEFGPDKGDPATNASRLTLKPWQIEVLGDCDHPGVYELESLLEGLALEERIYRLRCVEAWSMVVPWIGVPLASVLRRFKPTTKAKFVAFETLVRPEEMPGQASAFSTIDWPYREGLRLDEAMHPLTMLAVGLYGKPLLGQSGAPIRLVVPWKYGFKSIKSIVKIRFQESQPKTTWQSLAPDEYGFYANVNPQVDHPRWSQKRERRLPSGLFSVNWKETQRFNGYEDAVAPLYAGMDLTRFF